MFKIETYVKLALCTALLMAGSAFGTEPKSTSPPNSSATNNNNNGGNFFSQPTNNDMAIKLYHEKCFNKDTGKRIENDECAELQKEAHRGDDSDVCSSAGHDYTIARQDFGKACGEGDIAMEGNLACAPALARCSCANPRNKDKFIGNQTCSSSASEAHPDYLDTKDPIVRLYKYCPSRAASDYSQIKEDKEKADDKADTAEEKLPDLQEASDKARSEANQKMNDIDGDVNKSNADFQQKEHDSKDKLTQVQQQIRAKVADMTKHLRELKNQQRELELKKADAAVAKDQMVTQALLNCHAQASAAGAKAMADAANQIRAGVYNVKSQRNMLRRKGTTLEIEYQRRADKIFLACKKDMGTTETIKRANDVLDNTTKHLDAAKQAAEDEIKETQDMIPTIADDTKPCTGGAPSTTITLKAGDTEACQAVKSFAEDEFNRQNQHQMDLDNLAKKRAQAAEDGQRAASTADQKMYQGQMKAYKYHNEARDLEAELKAAKDAGATGSVEKGKWQEAYGKFMALNAAAGQVISCEQGCTSPTCQDAKHFLNETEMKDDITPPRADGDKVQLTPADQGVLDPEKGRNPPKGNTDSDAVFRSGQGQGGGGGAKGHQEDQ